MISSSDAVGYWVAERINGHYLPEISSALGYVNGEIKAGVIYENWNRASVVCHIAIDKMSPAYLAAIFHYPFLFLGVKKIIAPVAESNIESRRFVAKLGFRKETQILDAHPDGSLLIYTMTQEQCRFIGVKYGKRCRQSTQN